MPILLVTTRLGIALSRRCRRRRAPPARRPSGVGCSWLLVAVPLPLAVGIQLLAPPPALGDGVRGGVAAFAAGALLVLSRRGGRPRQGRSRDSALVAGVRAEFDSTCAARRAAGAPLGLQSPTCRADVRTWCAVERSRVCACTTGGSAALALDSGAVRTSALALSGRSSTSSPRWCSTVRRFRSTSSRRGGIAADFCAFGVALPLFVYAFLSGGWVTGCPWASCVRPRQRGPCEPGTPARMITKITGGEEGRHRQEHLTGAF